MYFMILIGNVALRKTTRQLGNLKPPHLAVDGITYHGADDDSCAHPYSGGPPVWWYVDLGQSYRITQVVLFQRGSVGAASKYKQKPPIS